MDCPGKYLTLRWRTVMTTLKGICTGPGNDLPLVSIFLGGTALLLFLFGESVSFLQYDRTAIADGELWRCLTGHVIHWNFDHFLWCAVTFAALGCISERLCRNGYIVTLAVAGFIIPAVLWHADVEMHTYRGLSGLASAIFVFAAMLINSKAQREKNLPVVILSTVAGLGYLAKILFEYATGSTLFVAGHDVFTPVPLAHLSGGFVGLVMAFVFCRKRV